MHPTHGGLSNDSKSVTRGAMVQRSQCDKQNKQTTLLHRYMSTLDTLDVQRGHVCWFKDITKSVIQTSLQGTYLLPNIQMSFKFCENLEYFFAFISFLFKPFQGRLIHYMPPNFSRSSMPWNQGCLFTRSSTLVLVALSESNLLGDGLLGRGECGLDCPLLCTKLRIHRFINGTYSFEISQVGVESVWQGQIGQFRLTKLLIHRLINGTNSFKISQAGVKSLWQGQIGQFRSGLAVSGFIQSSFIRFLNKTRVPR
jgi:hypothetical protein